MIQHIPWYKLTLTGRLFSIEEVKAPFTWIFLLKCVIYMAFDITICLLVTIASYRLLAWTLFTPTERGFHCADPNIREHYRDNTVPTLVLLGITLAGPLLIIILADFITKMGKPSKDLTDIFNQSTFVYLDYVIAFWVTTLVLDVIKCFVGRTRPNFLAMCSPRELREICEDDPEAFIPVAHCTANWKSSRNSKLSFPSGHAAISTFATLFLFFYLRGVQRRHPQLCLRLLFWSVSALFGAFTVYCCVSRITDCWHFPTDVMGGIAIGSLLFHLLLHKYYKIFP